METSFGKIPLVAIYMILYMQLKRQVTVVVLLVEDQLQISQVINLKTTLHIGTIGS
ncbi:MAG: hypothetical protein IPJ26_05490 [Bacteroidetes bacterium]|nr:hypothetical protein [Bacteroidota bacterium]